MAPSAPFLFDWWRGRDCSAHPCASPSPLAARASLRLSKIAPGDFVEPSARVRIFFAVPSLRRGPMGPLRNDGGGASLERTLLCGTFSATGKNTGNNCTNNVLRKCHSPVNACPVRRFTHTHVQRATKNRELTGNNNSPGTPINRKKISPLRYCEPIEASKLG